MALSRVAMHAAIGLLDKLSKPGSVLDDATRTECAQRLADLRAELTDSLPIVAWAHVLVDGTEVLSRSQDTPEGSTSHPLYGRPR